MKPYARFLLMIGVSAVLMHAVMYLNVRRLDHVFFSEMRVYMTLLMAASMAGVMLAFMRGMYPRRAANAAILAGAGVVFVAALWLARSQDTVDDVSYMKAMIPHHSIAILTSERARLSDPRVQDLAERIRSAQVREIEEMKALIHDLETR